MHQSRTESPSKPTLEGRHHVTGCDFTVIMPLEAVTQGEGICHAVIGNRPVSHLRLRPELVIHAQQGIENHVTMVTSDMGGGGDNYFVIPKNRLKRSSKVTYWAFKCEYWVGPQPITQTGLRRK